MTHKAICLLTALASPILITQALGGALDPPGAPASTPGPEARIAVSAENTPGDADSVHRITESGSYYLTGDLTGESGKSGIEIVTSDVTLDLNGFSIIGTAGALDGIVCQGTLYGLAIHDGRVWGWPGDGVDAGGAVRSRITGITSTNNALVGIHVGARSMIGGCIADANTGTGLEAGPNCTVSDCLAQLNGGDGIVSGVSSTIRECTSSLNTGDGIVVNGRCRVSGCTVETNSSVGIMVEGDENHIEDNTVAGNGGWGIETGSTVQDNAILGNRVTRNGTGGIYIWDLTSDNVVMHNTVSDNTGTGILDDNGANEVYGNVAVGNTTNYAGAGLVVTTPTTSTGPWANISR